MKLLRILTLALVVLFSGWAVSCRQDAPTVKPVPVKDKNPTSGSVSTPSGKNVPAYVLETLAYVKQYQKAPEGYVGGREFQNREKNLPLKTPDGSKIRYREWDVHPKERGVNRGAERLVTGNDQSAWYTKNHYKSFTRIE